MARPEAVVIRHLDAIRSHDPEEISSVLASNWVGHHPTGSTSSRDRELKMIAWMHSLSSAWDYAVEDQVVQDQRVATRVRSSVIHDREQPGWPATRRQLAINVIRIDHVRADRIVETWFATADAASLPDQAR